MFFAVNGSEFRQANPELEKFVLNPNLCGLPQRVSVYAFLNGGRRGRNAGITGVVNTATGQRSIFSETVFCPLGFVLCLDSPPPDPRLVDITWFSQFGYQCWRDLSLRLPLLSVTTAFPGDYANLAEVRQRWSQGQASL
jgi:hypothetical protein